MKPKPSLASNRKIYRADELSTGSSADLPSGEDQLRRLREINVRLSSMREIDPLMEYVIDQALDLCAAQRGFVALSNSTGSTDVKAMRGMTQAEIEFGRLDGELMKAAFRSEQSVPLSEIAWADRPGNARSGWCIPLRCRSNLIGAIYIDRPSINIDSAPVDGDLVMLFANQAATAIDNLQTHQAALTAKERADSLEQQLNDRMADLQKANVLLAQRALQLETHSQVAQQITSLLDLDSLLTQIVQFIQASFGYYFVGVWLAASPAEDIVLRAGTERSGGSLYGLHIPPNANSLVVGVCRSGKYRLANDVAQAPDYYRVAGTLPDTRSELALPLHVGDHVLGALDIHSDQMDTFSHDDRIVLQILADQIAVAIRNAQLYALEQDRRQLAESLEQSGRELSISLDMYEVPNRILNQLATVVPFERGSVMLQTDDQLHIAAEHGFPDRDRASDLQAPIHDQAHDIYQQILTTSRPIVIDDVTREPSWRQVEWLPLNRSWLGVPLIVNDRVMGMISLTRREAAAFNQDDATVVSAFAGQAAIALENARLYAEIRRFNEQLEQMVQARTAELNKAYTTLEHLDQTKSDFIEVAAHELRTPLTVIKGYAQLLDTDPHLGDDPDLKLMLSGIIAGTVRLQDVVNDMLDVTKIDSEALHMHRVPMRVGKAVRSVAMDFQAALRDRNLVLTLNNLDSLPTIQADSEMLYKVFYHLVNNAIKYTPDGGSITVRGQAISEKDRLLAIEVVVSDTGIGIDPQYHELIFEKFYRTGEVSFHSSGRTKFKGGGPGLGLAIAKGIVLAHGGRIWVESPGYDEERLPGSQFHVLLPVSG